MADIKSLLGDDYREDMTIEEINSALESRNFVDPATLPESVKKSVFDKTAAELAKVKKELKELKDSNLSDDEKLQKQLEAATQREKEASIKMNRLDVEKLFVAEGLTEADYAEILDDIVSEDAEKTVATAKRMLAVIKSQKVAAEKATREKLLKETPKPPAGSGPDGKITLTDFRKMSPKERYDFSVNHPDEYKELYGG